MARTTGYVIGITIVAALGGCPESKPPAPETPLSASGLPHIKVTAKAKMLLTYAKADGSFASVSKLDEVPEERRGWVRVVDLSIKPGRRLDHELVYVADLREAHKDGSYPYVVLPRATFEEAAVNRAHSGATDKAAASQPSSSARVVLYSTKWCPACRAARRYLKQHKIPFVDKDIESDRAAAAELLAKARAAGISASGVPVLDVGGTLMQGFDPAKLSALLGGKT